MAANNHGLDSGQVQVQPPERQLVVVFIFVTTAVFTAAEITI